MGDDQLVEVSCSKCDEKILAMFFNDHVCDPKKLSKMVRNKSGQYAEKLDQS